jgi:hypothetical protein
VKIFVYFIGKPKDPHANAVAEDFLGRAARYSPAMQEIRPDRTDLWAKHPAARKIFLDPAGKPMDSPAFAQLIARAEMEGRDLVFLIGGHDGSAARLGRARRPAALALRHDLSARIGARHARRTDLPRLRNLAGPSLPALT